MRHYTTEELIQRFRFPLPRAIVGFIAAIALSQLHAYLLCHIEGLRPLIYGFWAIWFVAALLTCLSAYGNQQQGKPPIQLAEARMIAVLLGLLILVGIGFGFEQYRDLDSCLK